MFSIMILLYDEQLVIQNEAKLLTQYTIMICEQQGTSTILKCINFPPLCRITPAQKGSADQ